MVFNHRSTSVRNSQFYFIAISIITVNIFGSTTQLYSPSSASYTELLRLAGIESQKGECGQPLEITWGKFLGIVDAIAGRAIVC